MWLCGSWSAGHTAAVVQVGSSQAFIVFGSYRIPIGSGRWGHMRYGVYVWDCKAHSRLLGCQDRMHAILAPNSSHHPHIFGGGVSSLLEQLCGFVDPGVQAILQRLYRCAQSF